MADFRTATDSCLLAFTARGGRGALLVGMEWHLAICRESVVVLAASCCLALHFNFNSRFSSQLPPMLLTTLQLFTAGCLGITLSWLTESWPATISPVTWKWFALSVLLATSLRYLMQTMGQKSANPTNAALLMLLGRCGR